jgi:hypothetical protein
MQVDLSLSPLEPQVAATAFDTEIADKLISYLRNDCILDNAGVTRVMSLLKQTYINGIRILGAQVLIHPEAGVDPSEAQPSQEIMEATARALGEQVCSNIMDNLIQAQTDLLMSMAWTLAALDERVYKRPRH